MLHPLTRKLLEGEGFIRPPAPGDRDLIGDRPIEQEFDGIVMARLDYYRVTTQAQINFTISILDAIPNKVNKVLLSDPIGGLYYYAARGNTDEDCLLWVSQRIQQELSKRGCPLVFPRYPYDRGGEISEIHIHHGVVAGYPKIILSMANE